MSTKKASNDIIDTMGEWFDKFPPMPKNWQVVLVRIIPVLALVFGILGILSILTVIGNGTGLLVSLFYLIASVLLLMAYPQTKGRKYKGWIYLFWSGVAHLIGGLLTMEIIITLLTALIGFYLIFQVRHYYK